MNVPRLVVFGLVFASSVAACFAQDEKPKTDPPRRDPDAVKKVESHDSAMYVPREAGLKDLAITLHLPIGVLLDLKWKAPDKTAWAVRIPEEVPKKDAERLRITVETEEFRARTDAQVPAFLETIVGGRESTRYAGDGLELVGDKVKIVAKSQATLAVMKEALLTFDEKGRVVSMSVTSPLGAVSEFSNKFDERDGKSTVKETTITTKTPAGPQVATVANEYEDVGGFRLLKRFVMKNGPQGDQDLKFSDHKPNGGLKDDDLKKP
jgi:hypothetical protein